MGIQKVIRIILLSACLLTAGFNSFAAQPDKIDDTVLKLAQKYENVEGVECLVVVKGEGLELIKMMLKKEFGKKFMKGVTAIVIIDYSNAAEDTCQALHKELDIFTSMLEEFNLNEEEGFSDSQFVRCFANESGSGVLSDFVVALEDGESKMILYMGGEIITE